MTTVAYMSEEAIETIRDKMIEIAQAHAKSSFEEEGQVRGIFVVMFPTPAGGEVRILPGSWADSQERAAILGVASMVMTLCEVPVYVHCSEVWRKTYDKRPAPGEKIVMPMDSEDRTEGVSVVVRQRGQENLSLYAEIHRDESGSRIGEYSPPEGGAEGDLFALIPD